VNIWLRRAAFAAAATGSAPRHLAEIKQRFPDLPVMMITAYGDDARRRRAAESGASEFLTKPVDFDRLKEQLRQLPTAAD
jgi:DNA-binding NtrC family response regulator